jgi:hypothetical protein
MAAITFLQATGLMQYPAVGVHALGSTVKSGPNDLMMTPDRRVPDGEVTGTRAAVDVELDHQRSPTVPSGVILDS